ncbi:hypothetical protein [Mycoplasmopsis gallopavonis]|uniref:Uncharacterized protein n=1 Tax=Mycoplasmopsis gallopavonis TaxID=76629 RepID=A0A449AYY8_9BACT|nr:hypothetical protein [Mycoplasmopsis gallopavonis]VEU72702.1 Uncharacterised protein [Mycoplasmopsis gallopavonis]
MNFTKERQVSNFKDLKKLAIKNDLALQGELKWLAKYVNVDDLASDNQANLVKVNQIGLDPKTILNSDLSILQSNFQDLENQFLLEAGCFMDAYSFESDSIDWMLSLVDQNSAKKEQNQPQDMHNTTKIIVNKLDI